MSRYPHSPLVDQKSPPVVPGQQLLRSPALVRDVIGSGRWLHVLRMFHVKRCNRLRWGKQQIFLDGILGTHAIQGVDLGFDLFIEYLLRLIPFELCFQSIVVIDQLPEFIR